MKNKGFTIVELMIASLLFGMVIAALAAIYSSAFSQSGKTFREGRTKTMATYSMKTLLNTVAQATRIDAPSKNTSGSELSGCWNAKSDGSRITMAENSTRFHFCLRNTAMPLGQACDGDPDDPPCLFFYSRSVAGDCPVSDVTSGNCGSTLGGMGAPQLLAAALESIPGLPAGIIFSRQAGQFAQEDNAVRIGYAVTKPASHLGPKIVYEVDTTASAHFGVTP